MKRSWLLVLMVLVFLREALCSETPQRPRINGPDIYGVRPLSPIVYRLPVTGDRPMELSAEGLPKGVFFDAKKGVLSGRLDDFGTNSICFVARNAAGETRRKFRLVGSDIVPLTPPMGFNTFGGLGSGSQMTEENVRASVRALFEKGLVDHGYAYCNIDDGWQGKRTGPLRALQANEKFPDIPGLFAWLHAEGVKGGLYSTPWCTSYGGYQGGSSTTSEGSWNRGVERASAEYVFDAEDARQIADWGCDYWKYDSKLDYVSDALGRRPVELGERMAAALKAQGRDIVFELSNTVDPDRPAEIDRLSATATMLRFEDDYIDAWETEKKPGCDFRHALQGVRDIWNLLKRWQPRTRTGHWVFPGPLRVGMLGGWDGKPLAPSRLTVPEQYTHVSLWCIWGSPLIIGAPIDKLDAFTLSLLTNDEILAVDQDALGSAPLDEDVPNGEVVRRLMENGDWVVGLFNPLGETESDVSVDRARLGLEGRWRVRDLWAHRDMGELGEKLTAKSVPRHGCRVYRLSRCERDDNAMF